jgi:DNA polymerase-3 subunit alpha
MDHGIDIESRVFPDLLRLAKDIGAPLVATNDLHYVRESDANSQEALLAINSGATLDDPTRFKFDGTGYYVKSAAEMAQVFPDHPEALANTLLIAEQCEVEFELEMAKYMPHFPVPDGFDEESYLKAEVARGLERRFPHGVPGEVLQRAATELEVIIPMGFAGYFLIVADFINWAKDRGIRVGPGRGSGPGSMVAYALRITDLDPIAHGLLFERFLNPERVSMPDIDVDFDERRRDEVIQYVSDKYGEDRVAQIVTYGTIKTKQALKDSARLLGLPFGMGEKLTKTLPPPVMAKDITVAGIFNENDPRYKEAEEFRDFVAGDTEAQRVVELAKGIEGLKRQWGVHACGIIMSAIPLTDVIPIMRRPADGATITQFKYEDSEALGLIKMDFLGLRNLTVLDDALENIVQNGKSPVILEDLLLDDAPTFELLARGDTLGVFQLDGGPMRSLLKLMRPDHFEDISAVLALYRPGPMGVNSHTNYALRKNKLQEIEPIHPELAQPLAEILGGTYGLIVYQEQVMAAAQKVAGYTLGGADILRRVMGKKKRSELEKQQTIFFAGMTERGFSAAAQQALWNVLESFADYAFNKAHTAAYGLISYWTAYLKANYPAEYMAALLQSSRGDKKKLSLYLNECRRMGIKVLPPDVNESAAKFTAVGDAIRFGLNAIRNVGDNVVASIITARVESNKFDSFNEFLAAVPAVVCNKRTIDSLVKAGAFDSIAPSRRALSYVHEALIDEVLATKKQESEGLFDLFALEGFEESPAVKNSSGVEIPDIPDWDKKTKLTFEREMLGLYVSDHPLAGLEQALLAAATVQIATLTDDDNETGDNATVTIAGLITSVTKKTAKSGNSYAIVELEDISGAIEVSFFGETYLQYETNLVADQVVAVKGRVQKRDEAAMLRAQELSAVNTQIALDDPFILTVPFDRCVEPLLIQLKEILAQHGGPAPVRLIISEPGKRTVVQAGSTFGVGKSEALFGDVKALLGKHCLAGVA